MAILYFFIFFHPLLYGFTENNNNLIKTSFNNTIQSSPLYIKTLKNQPENY